ncbi:MAG: HNH endonuclease [Spirochaetia bacterium]|jgi:putative restriction endonuclease|nr:HNH endonuclease [Spirochaetia bacterium]
MPAGKPWNEKETILALWLYYCIPPGKVDSNNPQIAGLAKLLGRSSNAVALKIANLKAYDRNATGKGMSNGSHWDRELPEKYLPDPEKLFQDCQTILLDDFPQSCNSIHDFPLTDAELQNNSFTTYQDDKTGLIKIRERQQVFRQILLTNYHWECCLSGITNPDFLVASHIVPWAADKAHRVDPQNGLLLNTMLDRAFDKGYFSLHPSTYEVMVASGIRDEKLRNYLNCYNGREIMLPQNNFRKPKKEFLEFHNENIFEHFNQDDSNSFFTFS